MIKKQITISSIAFKDGRYSLKDQDNITYSFFEKKQDQTISKAMQGFQEYGLAVGSRIGINYDEKQSGERTYKNIMFFEAPTAQSSTQQPLVPQKTATENTEPLKAQSEVDWDKISWGKCKHAFLVEAFKYTLGKENTISLNDFRRDIEPEAEQWADMSMRKLPKEQPIPKQPIPREFTQPDMQTAIDNDAPPFDYN